MKHFVLRSLLFGVLVLAVQWLVVSCRGPGLDFADNARFERAMQQGVDIVFMGDSTLYWYDIHDSDDTTTPGIVHELLPSSRIFNLSHGAYNADVYAPFSRSMVRAGHRPKSVIIVVNMRSFSAQWDSHPRFQFEREKTILAFRDSRFEFMLRPLMLFKAFDLESISQEEYLAVPVYRGPVALGRVGDFEHHRVEPLTKQNLRDRFAILYMYELDSSHRKIRSLVECIEALKSAGTEALFYVTPLDFESGIESLGEEFSLQVQKNVRVVEEVIREHDGEFLDLSDMLGSEAFDWHLGRSPNEHLTEVGRAALADRLAQWLASDFEASVKDVDVTAPAP